MASLSLSLSLHLTPKPLLNPKPLSSVSFIRRSTAKVPQSRKSTIPRMSLNPTPATDRLISAAAYTLPFFNALQYGSYLFMRFPQLRTILDPIFPLLSLYRSIPYASFVAFFALYLGVVRNEAFSHYVRFNTMQAVVLDVLLVVPVVLTQILSPGRAGLWYRALVWGYSAVFVLSCLCFAYAVVSCVMGRTPYLPFVGGAAGRQV
ncbi:hypothetical protein SLEP1_g36984 [Rubroshorea leprosula]|uniref:Protein TIC 20 n=1 Tax=Rubroshorea leprosula TaxID=152421 RepID=A0AAV5KT98_9ROSI|nr:hypothetical protein SLEP1_g36984 [Rubroshorea leprosula]